jgi:lipopolysaccharide export system permease protein
LKILDRYVLVSFLKNYLISFMVLIGLYIVLDMVFNFDELAQVQSSSGASGVQSALAMIQAIGNYYFFQSFTIFVHLAGIIPIVAAAFTLIRLTRFNELTASLAAGVPLLRTAMPIVIAAVVLNVLLIIDQEALIPNMIPQIARKHDEIQSDAAAKTFPIRAMQDDQHELLNAARYHPGSAHNPPWMEVVDIIKYDDAFMPVAHILADQAQWDAKGKFWRLTNGQVVTGLRPTEKVSRPRPVSVYRSSVTPDEVALYNSGEHVDLLSTSRIKMLLQRPKSYGVVALQRVKHARFTQPLLNVILVLLAVSCLVSREPGRIKSGIFQCAVLCGACLTTIFLCYQLAGTPPSGAQWADRWPAIMAWTPILIFGPLAVWLLDRVKT